MRIRHRSIRAVTAAVTATGALLSACSGSPVTETAQEATEPDGRSLFAQHCSACHGPLAEGDGPVANVMLVTVPNLRSLQERAGGTFPREPVMRYIDGRDLPAAHGDRYMPVWGETFAAVDEDGVVTDEAMADDRIGAIVDYLESIQN
jgi:mono/diheme cytochrome c family protein